MKPTHPIAIVSTWFGSGLIPGPSGTWGSLAALPFAWLILLWAGPWGLVLGAALAFAVGVWASDRYAAAIGKKDPGAVVIDEVAGQWLALAPLPLDPLAFLGSFFLFRFFDIVKPWPAGWCDRNLDGGWGIMVDDIFAGLYAAIAGWIGWQLWLSVTT